MVKGFLLLAGVFSGGVAESGRVAVFCFFGGVGCEGFRTKSIASTAALVVCTSRYARFNVAYMSIHPPQCSKLLFFSAVSVRERFQENHG